MSKCQLMTEGHIFAFLTYFEKLLYCSQSFAQRNIYNHQKLNPFEEFAHDEN